MSGPNPGQAYDLHRFAERLAKEGQGKGAIVIDLSGIPEVNDRLFFRAMVRFIEERVGDKALQVVPMARHCVAILANMGEVRTLAGRFDELAKFLNDQHHGTLRVVPFNLEHEARRFVEMATRLMEQNPLPEPDRTLRVPTEAAPDMAALDRYLSIDRSLQNADISSLTRSQDQWHLAPDVVPIAVAREIWVSMPALEDRLSLDLRGDRWLFSQTTEITDHRLIAYLAKHDLNEGVPVCVNLHLQTVHTGDFRRFTAVLTEAERRRLTFELSQAERRATPELFVKTVDYLHSLGCFVALDGLAADDLPALLDGDWRQYDYLKLDWPSVLGREEEAAAWIVQLGAERFVLHHCDDDRAVSFGLPLKVTRYQGRGIQAFVDNPERVRALLGNEAGDAVAAMASAKRRTLREVAAAKIGRSGGI